MVEYARHRGVRAQKMSFGGGWPDYLFLYRGRCLFIEFKAPGEKPSKLQRYVIDTFIGEGFDVVVIDNLIDGREAIRKFIDDNCPQRVEGV